MRPQRSMRRSHRDRNPQYTDDMSRFVTMHPWEFGRVRGRGEGPKLRPPEMKPHSSPPVAPSSHVTAEYGENGRWGSVINTPIRHVHDDGAQDVCREEQPVAKPFSKEVGESHDADESSWPVLPDPEW